MLWRIAKKCPTQLAPGNGGSTSLPYVDAEPGIIRGEGTAVSFSPSLSLARSFRCYCAVVAESVCTRGGLQANSLVYDRGSAGACWLGMLSLPFMRSHLVSFCVRESLLSISPGLFFYF